MRNKILGGIGIAGAPFLMLDFYVHGFGNAYEATSLGGLFSLIYISAWMCSVFGLLKAHAGADLRRVRLILFIHLIFLTLANIWNCYEIISPGSPTIAYRVLDLFWPISNTFSIVTGVAIFMAGRLTGHKRVVPLLVSAWLPLSIAISLVLAGDIVWVISGIYSVVMWGWLGAIVMSLPDNKMEKVLVR